MAMVKPCPKLVVTICISGIPHSRSLEHAMPHCNRYSSRATAISRSILCVISPAMTFRFGGTSRILLGTVMTAGDEDCNQKERVQ